MATEVIMPKVDMVMETGTFVEWLKKENEQVSKGDPLFVITTDKAAIEVEAPADGILAGVTAKADDIIPVTEVIGYILAPGEALPAKAAPQIVASAVAPSVAEIATLVEPVAVAAEAAEPGKVRVTPIARHLAKEMGVDLKQITGRGPRGRIHKADVLAFQKPQPSDGSQSAPVPALSPVTSATPRLPARAVSSPSIPLPDARRKQVIPLAARARSLLSG